MEAPLTQADHSRSITEALEHPRRLVIGRVRSPTTARRDAITEAVGQRFCVRRVAMLVGVVRGQLRRLGVVQCDGHPLLWDYWFPHLGIAVDTAVLPERESAVKAEWADAEGILYFSPRVNASPETDEQGRAREVLDLQGLAVAAASRRAACARGGE